MALTFNLPSQIVVQTAAQWAVDATVYSNKRILVTSDEYYGSTDQRKFKIADGTQTWAQLDYAPLSQTLAQVLANGNSTGNTAIQSPSGDSQIEANDSESSITHYDLSGNGGGLVNNPTKTTLSHSLQIDLEAQTINLVQGIPSSIVETDASKNLTYAAKATGYNLNLGTTAGTVLEGNRITQTITNGVTDKAPSEDAVYDALALKLDANNAAVTNARNRKYFAYDNTTYTYTGTTANTIVRTIPIEVGDMLENSTLSLMMNFFKVGTNNTFSMFLYITTNSSAATGGTQIGANGTGSTVSLQFGKHFRLTNKNSLTDQLGQTSGNNADDFSTMLNGAKQVLTIDFTVKQYLHIVMKANSASDTVGISDYQAYIDNP